MARFITEEIRLGFDVEKAVSMGKYCNKIRTIIAKQVVYFADNR